MLCYELRVEVSHYSVLFGIFYCFDSHGENFPCVWHHNRSLAKEKLLQKVAASEKFANEQVEVYTDRIQ
jgi:hypothetical protein